MVDASWRSMVVFCLGIEKYIIDHMHTSGAIFSTPDV